MPGGYVLVADANEVARTVLDKSSWAVLALTCHVELFTQVHYRESIERDEELSDLYRDVFRFHWLEECQHAVMDEIEWCREDRTLSPEERDAAVDDLIALICGLDRPAARAVGRGCRLLHAPVRSHLHAGRAARDPRDRAARVSLAVHRVRRASIRTSPSCSAAW